MRQLDPILVDALAITIRSMIVHESLILPDLKVALFLWNIKNNNGK